MDTASFFEGDRVRPYIGFFDLKIRASIAADAFDGGLLSIG